MSDSIKEFESKFVGENRSDGIGFRLWEEIKPWLQAKDTEIESLKKERDTYSGEWDKSRKQASGLAEKLEAEHENFLKIQRENMKLVARKDMTSPRKKEWLFENFLKIQRENMKLVARNVELNKNIKLYQGNLDKITSDLKWMSERSAASETREMRLREALTSQFKLHYSHSGAMNATQLAEKEYLEKLLNQPAPPIEIEEYANLKPNSESEYVMIPKAQREKEAEVLKGAEDALYETMCVVGQGSLFDRANRALAALQSLRGGK